MRLPNAVGLEQRAGPYSDTVLWYTVDQPSSDAKDDEALKNIGSLHPCIPNTGSTMQASWKPFSSMFVLWLALCFASTWAVLIAQDFEDSYDAILRRFNLCMDRPEQAPREVHVWNGARGHGEIGNIFVGYTGAFLDALLANKDLVIGTEGKDYFEKTGTDLANHAGTQYRFARLFPVRLRFYDPARDGPHPSESGWVQHQPDLERFQLDERTMGCLRDAAPCHGHFNRRPTNNMAKIEAFKCASHPSMQALIAVDSVALSPLAEQLRAVKPYFTDPDLLERLVTDPSTKFFATIHLRLIYPRIDHSSDRNTDPCKVQAITDWTAGCCRNETWAAAAKLISSDAEFSPGAPVFVICEAAVVTHDLVEYLRAHGINAQGFKYVGTTEVASMLPRMDMVEWWLSSRSRRIYYARGLSMDGSPSSFTTRAADLANIPFLPLQKSCKCNAGKHVYYNAVAFLENCYSKLQPSG